MAAKVISENIEEYLEVLYKFGGKNTFVSTTTLSHELGIAPGSVTQMLKKLEDLGRMKTFMSRHVKWSTLSQMRRKGLSVICLNTLIPVQATV